MHECDLMKGFADDYETPGLELDLLKAQSPAPADPDQSAIDLDSPDYLPF